MLEVDIVVGVAIIWDKCTTMVIARQFDLVLIDRVHIDHIRLSIKLNHGLSWADCSSGKLWANIWVLNLHMTSNLVQLNAVRALGILDLSCLVSCNFLLDCMEELRLRVELFLFASKDEFTVRGHFWGEGKLLAE